MALRSKGNAARQKRFKASGYGPTANNDDWLNVVLTFDKANKSMILRIRAKRKIRIVEVQGFVSDLEAFGMEMPSSFWKMQFGEGVEMPEEMKNEMVHMNRLNFRWGCDFSLKANEEREISMPANGEGKEKGVLQLAYEYPRFLGLLKGKQGMYARLSA